MCGHAFLFCHRDDLQRHRPRWQCGTWGRVSSLPLDCCPRPDDAQHHSPQLTHLLRQWMSTCGRWTRASVRLSWSWPHRSATRAGAIQAPASPLSMRPGRGMLTAAAYDESLEGDDVMVVAGERQ